MRWDDRQAAMLAELGIRLWPSPQADAEPVGRSDSHPPYPPAEREGGEAGALQNEKAFAEAGTDEVHAPRAAAQGLTAIASMDWPALRAAVAGCTACGLCRGRTQTVFGVGHPSAHWMIVGEAPGEQEDRQGEPFVGKAGQLLDNMLRALGLSRNAGPDGGDAARQIFIANVLKCRPPMNRNPAPDEVAQCEPYLRRQVALVRPRMILAMGRFAVQSLLRSDLPVGKLRGRLHAYEGVPLIVTYHPAYLLRSPAEKARAWDDLCLARAALRMAGQAESAGGGA